jgi:hypothetical protein
MGRGPTYLFCADDSLPSEYHDRLIAIISSIHNDRSSFKELEFLLAKVAVQITGAGSKWQTSRIQLTSPKLKADRIPIGPYLLHSHPHD